jgi:uncharacterized protein (DUF1015 family)
MAQIQPFKGFCYRLEKPDDLGVVAAPPYDMIDGSMIDELYKKDASNIVRIIQNKKQPSDKANSDRHDRAAGFLRQWIKDGTLFQDALPSVYLYKQEFPVSGDASGARLTRTGVIVLVKLVDYEEGVVFPHEYTLTGPKIDRYELLKATQSHSELIFGIVPDQDRALYHVISSARTTGCKGRFIDGDGVEHGLYQSDDAALITSLQNTLSLKTILIADGHHRYETALKYYRDSNNQDHAYVMMSLVSMADPGLVIRAFHRVLKKYPGTETLDVHASLKAYFTMEDLGSATHASIFEGLKPGSPCEMLYFDARSRHAFGMTLNARGEGYLAEQTGGMSATWNHLDVSKINSIVINKILGLPLDGKILHDVFDYVNDLSSAFEKAALEPSAYHGVFFIRPIDIAAVNAIVSGKERMPQKSTNFFPKCWSGLVINVPELR